MVARTALAQKMHGIGDTGALSIKKHCAGASQLDHGDACVVSVVLEHGGQPITGANGHSGSMFWRCDVGEPQTSGSRREDAATRSLEH